MTSEIVAYDIVVFEDTGEERKIVRDCRRCNNPATHGLPVISPTGVAHIVAGGERTFCGKDATGDGWWWES